MCTKGTVLAYFGPLFSDKNSMRRLVSTSSCPHSHHSPRPEPSPQGQIRPLDTPARLSEVRDPQVMIVGKMMHTKMAAFMAC